MGTSVFIDLNYCDVFHANLILIKVLATSIFQGGTFFLIKNIVINAQSRFTLPAFITATAPIIFGTMGYWIFRTPSEVKTLTFSILMNYMISILYFSSVFMLYSQLLNFHTGYKN